MAVRRATRSQSTVGSRSYGRGGRITRVAISRATASTRLETSRTRHAPRMCSSTVRGDKPRRLAIRDDVRPRLARRRQASCRCVRRLDLAFEEVGARAVRVFSGMAKLRPAWTTFAIRQPYPRRALVAGFSTGAAIVANYLRATRPLRQGVAWPAEPAERGIYVGFWRTARQFLARCLAVFDRKGDADLFGVTQLEVCYEPGFPGPSEPGAGASAAATPEPSRDRMSGLGQSGQELLGHRNDPQRVSPDGRQLFGLGLWSAARAHAD